MDLHRDFKDLLEVFVLFEVEFAVIGGYAVGHHAKPRATKDLDVLVSGRGENRLRVAKALESFGAPPNVVVAASQQQEHEIVYMGVPPVRIDIIRTADGVETDAVIRRAVTVKLGDLRVPLISLEDLIVNKRSSGRPQDLADVALLKRVSKGRDEPS